MKTMFSGAYAGRRVLVTGHTGFKGAWLSLWLHRLGAHVAGYSLEVASDRGMFMAGRVGTLVDNHYGDICDTAALTRVFEATEPEIVFHLAAQAIVRASYDDPIETFRVNVLGVGTLLEVARRHPSVRSVVVVTSDKCYQNSTPAFPCREFDPLGGRDPYSASKACAEIVVSVYQSAQFERAREAGVQRIATARAGNVVGGGDWAADRLLPDIIRCVEAGRDIELRYPQATRPWQHVLEPLSGYLWLGACLFDDVRFAQAWNFGPADPKTWTVSEIASYALARLQPTAARLVVKVDHAGRETISLRVDSNKAAHMLGWMPVWSIEAALAATLGWYCAQRDASADLRALSIGQIDRFVRDAGRAAWVSGELPPQFLIAAS